VRKQKLQHDPRGHSIRIYREIYDSAAFASLSPHDVLAYLALLRELKGYNNGDLSLPLSRSKKCGINHPKTLARSLRALCAVGLVALARKGGCTKGGQRLPNLYRMTDRECFDIPVKHLEAKKESHEWKRVVSVSHGRSLIALAEDTVKVTASKLKSLGHAVTVTMAPLEVVRPITRAPRDRLNDVLGHGVTMAEKAANPLSMQPPDGFSPAPEKARHRAPHSPPLYVYQSTGQAVFNLDHGTYRPRPSMPVSLIINPLH
jgi:hypothetical protein